MRVLIAGFGTEGDTRPYLALAAGLAARGHAAMVCLDDSGRAPAEALGLPFRGLEGDFRSHMRDGDGERALEKADGGVTGLGFFGRLARAHTDSWMETLLSAVDEHDPDVVVGSGLMIFAAQAAAEACGRRFAVAGAFPMAPTREFASVVSPFAVPAVLNRATHHVASQAMWSVFRAPVMRARKALGLGRFVPPWNDVPVLYGFSPALVPRPADWRDNVLVCGDWHLADPEFRPPEDLAAFLDAGEPPAYVGFGSMVGTGDLTRTVLDALDGRRTLFAPGWSGLTADELGALPDSVHVMEPAPHSWVLPRCAYAMHHCGAGTTHAVARAGIPSIPVPFAADQPFWARRLLALGVAAAPLDRRTLTAGAVRAARDVVESEAARTRAAEVAARMATEDPIGAVADHLATFGRE